MHTERQLYAYNSVQEGKKVHEAPPIAKASGPGGRGEEERAAAPASPEAEPPTRRLGRHPGPLLTNRVLLDRLHDFPKPLFVHL